MTEKSEKRFEAGGASYGRSETEQLRGELIALRDEALKQSDFAWSVRLSHMIALWHAMINEIWGQNEPLQKNNETTGGRR